MSMSPFLVVCLLFYGFALAISGGGIFWIARGKIVWQAWEFGLMILPFLVWVVLIVQNRAGKSLTNALIEPLVCGFIAGLQPGFRFLVVHFSHQDHPKLSLIGVLISCIGALAVYYFTPTIAE